MINTILDIVLGIRKGPRGIQRRPGVFGTIQAYIGTAEAQDVGRFIHICCCG